MSGGAELEALQHELHSILHEDEPQHDEPQRDEPQHEDHQNDTQTTTETSS